jgi:hypothetical protein
VLHRRRGGHRARERFGEEGYVRALLAIYARLV